ncbi:Eukaryotic translation initiation factor 3 subunit C [Paragonimus heterotremus]|uniref:Eukaryotic translation initiation factor 3 subunit C n=1 Tax=Paragonimus heterotremus TaxID=100268 RepID=A0A8J4SJU8_9TREM|nr:Eukaryotic translation initiation factor 3 subunit C [Paragonimus heterotremus]
MTSSMFADAISSSESDDDEVPVQRTDNRFAHYPSDEEEAKRVVKSAKDKRFEEMQSIIKNLNNHKKIKDMSNVLTDFESLVRVHEKSLKLNEIDSIPAFYIRCIAELEDFVNDSWEKKKDLNRGAAKALTALRQRVKKYNRDFEDHLKDFREHPENYQEDEPVNPSDDEASGDSDAEPTSVKASAATTAVPEKKQTKKAAGSDSGSDEFNEEADEDDSDSEGFWDSDSDSSSSTDVDLERMKDDPSVYFLKKTTDDKKDKAKLKKVTKEKVVKKTAKSEDTYDSQGVWTTVDSLGRPEVLVQAFEKGQEITQEVVMRKLTEILVARGKKGTSISDQLALLFQVEEKIKEHRLSVGLHVKVLFSLISVFFDYDKNHAPCMSVVMFDRLLGVFDRLFDLLENHQVELLTPEVDTDDLESLETPPFVVHGSLIATMTLLNVECTKTLQSANGNGVEYVERLRDERRLCLLLDRLCSYLEKREADPADLCVAYQLKVEHMYYKFDFDWGKRVEIEGIEAVGPNESTAVIQHLCRYIYTHDRTDRLRTRAILCHIYHLALYDNWYQARDLMLMSNLQMSIEHADQSTMILYNRAMAQLGLSAFRQGHIRETHNALADLIGSGRIKELLAQGPHGQTRYERSIEEEKREQALQVPYHMYINTELIECVYHVCAMLLEIPNLAANETDLRWRPISKPFHMALRVHDRQTLIGPPETPRDYVLAAAKAMRYGNWKACTQYIINPKMDAKIWNLLFQSARVKTLLGTKIKEESLRSFLFTYSAIHDSISLDRLTEYFEMPKSSVYSIISKMIINQELAASLEVPSDFLIMHKTERSRLQTLALQLSEKISIVVVAAVSSVPRVLNRIKDDEPSRYQARLFGFEVRRQGLRYGLNKFN